MNRRHWSKTVEEREEIRRAKRLAEGLEELWEEATGDSEQSLDRALHEVLDPS